METELWKIIATFIIGFFGSWYGSQVGGGGLLLIPWLLFMGVPIHTTVGTHRLAIMAGKIFSVHQYLKAKQIIWSAVPIIFVLTMIANFIGGKIFLDLSEEKLKIIAAIGMTLPLLFMWKKKSGLTPQKTSITKRVIGTILLFGISIWSFFFSAGTGTVGMYILVVFWGMTFIQAKATRSLAGYPGGIYILIFMIYHNYINYELGIPAALGYMIGSHYGAKHAIKKGNQWVRFLLIIVVITSILKLLVF